LSLTHLTHGEFVNSPTVHPLGFLIFIGLVTIFLQSLRGFIVNKAWWQVVEKIGFQNSLLCGIFIFIGAWLVRLGAVFLS
jgi:hypothetical protein